MGKKHDLAYAGAHALELIRKKDARMSAPTLAAKGDPFLLPICECGGPMNLASLEPHAARPELELKTYKCTHCGSQQVFTVQKRVVRKA
jgi:hypothetical protein